MMRRIADKKIKSKPELTDVERRGRPEDIAAENVKLGFDYDEHIIGLPRASSLYDTCVRYLVLAKGQKETHRLAMHDRITFGIGDAVHYWIQNTPVVFGNNRVGWWKCLNCGKIRTFGRPPTKACRHCGAPSSAAIYHEHSLKSEAPYEGTGHPDLFIQKERHLRLVEIKTIASDQFKALIQPKIEHVWQIQFYMWACTNDKKLPRKTDNQVGYILYVSKGYIYHALPLKMFVVQRDPAILGQIKDKLAQYHYATTENQLPEHDSECLQKEFSCYRARDCSVIDKCRNGD